MLQTDTQARLRALPRTDEVLAAPRLISTLADVTHAVILGAVRDTLDDCRARILSGIPCDTRFDAIVEDACLRAELASRPSLRRVINATGIIIHTNLGRSVLAKAALDAVNEVAAGYSTLEYDVAAGKRGSRHAHIEELICKITGAEAAIAVNNNAAAVMLVLSEFANGKEAIISRGQLVEIGGSFRIPDIMAQSGAVMVEVGTTNKTHLRDYERAIGENTALILKVHPSNYRMVGFTEEVGLEELHELGKQRNIPVYEDQGSGVLFNLPCFGALAEPTVSSSIAAGANLVSFSGDKLLGGPQAGIIVGSKTSIARLKNHPLARVLRLDKMTIAALEATLRLCLDERTALREIPTLRMLSTPKEEVTAQAHELARMLAEKIKPSQASIEIVDEISRAGGGAMPLVDLPTSAVAIDPHVIDVVKLNSALIRERRTPVITRIKDDRILVDPRTLLSDEDRDEVVAAFAQFLGTS